VYGCFNDAGVVGFICFLSFVFIEISLKFNYPFLIFSIGLI
jgi:hypothetical protein